MEYSLAWILLAFVFGYAAGIKRGQKIERKKLIHKAAEQVATAIAGRKAGFHLHQPVDYAKPSSERTH